MGKCGREMCKCGDNSDKETEIVRTKLSKEDILYDIANLGYIEGDVVGEDAIHVKHVIQDICQEGNVDRVERILELVWLRCLDILSPVSAPDEELDRYEVLVAVKRIVLRRHSAAVRSIPALVRELMTATVLWEWLGISNARAAEKWGIKCEDLWDRLRSIVLRLQSPVRRPLSPW